VLSCYRSCRYKGLEKGLAGRGSKFKSKSSKNGLKSGLESKSGLEYYKSGIYIPWLRLRCGPLRWLVTPDKVVSFVGVYVVFLYCESPLFIMVSVSNVYNDYNYDVSAVRFTSAEFIFVNFCSFATFFWIVSCFWWAIIGQPVNC